MRDALREKLAATRTDVPFEKRLKATRPDPTRAAALRLAGDGTAAGAFEQLAREYDRLDDLVKQVPIITEAIAIAQQRQGEVFARLDKQLGAGTGGALLDALDQLLGKKKEKR